MNKMIVGLTLSLTLLAGCGGSDAAPVAGYDMEKTSQALVDCGGFGQVIDLLDSDMVQGFYGLSVVPDQSVVYASMEGGYEGFALLAYDSEETATTAKGELEAYVDDMIATETDLQYKPEDVPKLKDALLKQQGNTLLLVIAADYAPVETALEE